MNSIHKASDIYWSRTCATLACDKTALEAKEDWLSLKLSFVKKVLFMVALTVMSNIYLPISVCSLPICMWGSDCPASHSKTKIVKDCPPFVVMIASTSLLSIRCWNVVCGIYCRSGWVLLGGRVSFCEYVQPSTAQLNSLLDVLTFTITSHALDRVELYQGWN